MQKSFERAEDRLAFAYPYGMHTEAVIEILKELGVKLAFTTKSGNVTPSSDPYQLPRWIIYPNCTISGFAKIVG